MVALVTGASSGIGRDIALQLSRRGYKLILVARSEEKLKELSNELTTDFEILVADLNIMSDVDKVIKVAVNEKIDILVNNAGFGLYGEFQDLDFNRELEMINVNVIALHKITKEVYKMMKVRDSGYILNVASSAGLMPGGPLLTSYYATKSYVRSLTLGIFEESRRDKSKVHISLLCPGPVNTNFNKVAGTKFNISSLESNYVSKYALNKMFRNKLIIVPGFSVKLGLFISRFFTNKFILKISYLIQNKKRGK